MAALLHGVTSPLLAVGNRAVDAAPRPVKEWAIETFGTHDKPVLIGGVIATVALLAVVAGAVGVRRPRVAIGAFVLLTVVVRRRRGHRPGRDRGRRARLVPVLALLVVGLASLVWLLARVSRHRSG